jgi:hypothetical protein
MDRAACEHVLHGLRTGHFYIVDRPADDELLALWKANRTAILADWIQRHPGTRPWAWWNFEARERRRRIDGPVHPFDNPERLEHPAVQRDRVALEELHCGVPAKLAHPDDFAAEYESEGDYLARKQLLASGERKAWMDRNPDGRSPACPGLNIDERPAEEVEAAQASA